MWKTIQKEKNKGKVFRFGCGTTGEKPALTWMFYYKTITIDDSEKTQLKKDKDFSTTRRKDINKKDLCPQKETKIVYKPVRIFTCSLFY